MGCCVCRPKTEVTESPAVIICVRVKRALIMRSTSVDTQGQGLLYVQDGTLCLESTCGNRLYCMCFKKSWPLTDVISTRYVASKSALAIKLANCVLIADAPGATDLTRFLTSGRY